jgi:leucyl/phenylalanyl-tRNA--protein transferase
MPDQASSSLDLEILLSAYCQGYFPMPDGPKQLIRWYRPDPRAILPLTAFHASRSLIKKIRRADYEWSLNRAFTEVMTKCADRPDTWINQEFIVKYTRLHQIGYAHSLEIWCSSQLIGGVYGVAIGGAFFAESMFHRETDASKLALFHLVEQLKIAGFALLEVQFLTSHLASLGAITISDQIYMERLGQAIRLPRTLAASQLSAF